MKEKRITKSFLTCATLVTYIIPGVNLCFQHSTKAVVVESSEISDTATADFTTSIDETARQIGQERNLYASVMIVQAVLELNSGQSALSQSPYYSFFGTRGNYNGDPATVLIWEDDGNGNTHEVDQAFRSYDSLSNSSNDYANLLSWDLYSETWKFSTTFYQDAMAALIGLYATDTSYADKLNALIEQHGLTVYDEPAGTEEETGSEGNSDHAWNGYHGFYTTVAILAEDGAWLRLTSQ